MHVPIMRDFSSLAACSQDHTDFLKTIAATDVCSILIDLVQHAYECRDMDRYRWGFE